MALHTTLSPSSHEPMVMGSPPSPQAGYLPGYLMGGDSSLVSSPSHNLVQPSRSAGTFQTGAGMGLTGFASTSPNTIGNRSMQASFTQLSVSQSQQPRFNGSTSPLTASQRKRTPTVLGLDSRGRQGPPTTSLWATPPVHPAQARLGPTGATGVFQEPTGTPKGHSTPRLETSMAGSANRREAVVMNLFKDTSALPQSPAQMDPFFTQGESLRHDDVLDERWVTIFGYPSSAAAYTIEQFSHCGTIVKHVIANEGNWAHLKFQTKLQAKRALSKNGKIFAENFMVGVQPCIDKRVMSDDGCEMGDSVLDKSSTWEPIQRAAGHSVRATPNQPSINPQVSILGEQSMNTSFKMNASMRSLTANRTGTAAEIGACSRKDGTTSSDESQSKESILSKAFGFVFGWT